LVDFDRFWSFSCLSDVSPTDLEMLSFCWDFKFRCPFLIWFSEFATLVDVKQPLNILPMIPKSYENEYSISLILIAFEVFLVWVTFRRLTLQCCHSAGIPSSGSLFWFDFSESSRLVDVKQRKNILPMIPESYENEYSVSLILCDFEVFLVWVTFRRLTLKCCHSAGIPSSGALFVFDFRNLQDL